MNRFLVCLQALLPLPRMVDVIVMKRRHVYYSHPDPQPDDYSHASKYRIRNCRDFASRGGGLVDRCCVCLCVSLVRNGNHGRGVSRIGIALRFVGGVMRSCCILGRVGGAIVVARAGWRRSCVYGRLRAGTVWPPFTAVSLTMRQRIAHVAELDDTVYIHCV